MAFGEGRWVFGPPSRENVPAVLAAPCGGYAVARHVLSLIEGTGESNVISLREGRMKTREHPNLYPN